MRSSSTLSLGFLLLCTAPASATPFWRRGDAEQQRVKTDTGYVSPLDKGGSMLTAVHNTFPAGLGEPLNIIISANSDAQVLVDSPNNGGLRNYWLSLRFAGECLGQHLGDHQAANLGDGNGLKNETAVMRFDYDDPYLGTCQETIKGGNHFRYWTQNGKEANTGAVFMAASSEKPAADNHDIIPNGYNIGRDWIVGNATGGHDAIPTLALKDGDAFVGSTVFNGYTYQTTATYVAGLLQNASDGVNHFQSVPVGGRAAIDGLVAVLRVRITNTPTGAPKASGGGEGAAHRASSSWALACAVMVALVGGAWTVW